MVLFVTSHVCSERLLVVLRDGRTLIGFLRSVDQFGKLASPGNSVWLVGLPQEVLASMLCTCSNMILEL